MKIQHKTKWTIKQLFSNIFLGSSKLLAVAVAVAVAVAAASLLLLLLLLW